MRTTDTSRFVNLIRLIRPALTTEDIALVCIGSQTFDLHSPTSFHQLGQLHPELVTPNNLREEVVKPFQPGRVRSATTQNTTTPSPLMRLLQTPPPPRGQTTTSSSATNNYMTNSSTILGPGANPLSLRPEPSYYGSWINYDTIQSQSNQVSAEMSQALLSTYTPSYTQTPAQDRLQSFKKLLPIKANARPTYPPKTYAIVPPARGGGGTFEAPIRQGIAPIYPKDDERLPTRDNRPVSEMARDGTEENCADLPENMDSEN